MYVLLKDSPSKILRVSLKFYCKDLDFRTYLHDLHFSKRYILTNHGSRLILRMIMVGYTATINLYTCTRPNLHCDKKSGPA